MAARHPPQRSTSSASNSSQQPQQQQQQQPPPPLRRTLFSGSLTRRPATSSSIATTSVASSGTHLQTQTQTPYAHTNPSTSLAGANSGFTPQPALLSPRNLAPIYASALEDGNLITSSAFGEADLAGSEGWRDIGDDEEEEDDDIIVEESALNNSGLGRSATSDKELLSICLQEVVAADAGAGEAGDGAEGENGLAGDDSAHLIELYRNHARQRIDLNELKPAVEESLRRKVASLDDDKWMYEPESDSEES